MGSGTGLSEAIIASLILAMSVIAVGFAALRKPPENRTPFWFGMFGCLYGVRLAAQSELVQPFFPEVYWRSLDAFINYAIIVPAGLFADSVLGPGWRSTLRRAWQASAVFAALAILNDVTRREPGAALWMARPVVLTVGFIAFAHVLVYWSRGSWAREFRVAAAGGLIFLGVAAYATLSEGHHVLEAFAVLVLMGSVGYFVAQRMATSERRLIAVSRELDLAREIQQSILPRTLPETAGLRVAACYLPMSEIGGDFYDFDTRRPKRLGILVADVTGHGVPAALIAAMVKIAFAAETERLDDPGLVLTNMNRTLCGKFAGAYVTACCGVVDGLNRTLRYSGAGHPAPLLRRSDGRVEHLEERGLLLAFDTASQYATAEVALNAGDRVVFFSDGLVEACNARDEFFGSGGLEELLAGATVGTPGQFVDQLLAELRRWIAPETQFQDDVTIVVLDVGEEG